MKNYEEFIKLANECFEEQLSQTLWIITDDKERWELVDDTTKKQILGEK